MRRWRTKQLEYTWIKSLMGRYEDFGAVTRSAARAAAASMDLDLTAEMLDQLMDAYNRLPPFSDVAPALSALRTFRRAILSNGSPGMIAAAVANAGLRQQFDSLISVDEVGVFKPHPAVYGLVCKHWNVQPDEVAFVSSNFWDIAGACSYGFRTFWVNRGKTQPDQLGYQPTAALTTLTELAAALAA
jgi:2-haloacid dehalogenase